MDRKAAFILDLGKYAGYIAVLWVSISHNDLKIADPLIPFFLVFAVDNIRTYYLDTKMPSFNVPSFYAQYIFALAFIFFDGTPIGAILLIILIAESLLSSPHPHGNYIFYLSLTGFPLISASALFFRDTFNWNNMATVLINSIFFIFAYGVSYMTRKQIEEKERAEKALQELEHSRTDLENAYYKLIEANKELEQLAAEEERTRIARELHDTLAHNLTAIIVSLEAGKKLIEKEPHKAVAKLEKSQEQARRGLDEVRMTVKTLRSHEPEKMDFSAAVKSLARDYSSSNTEILFELDDDLYLPHFFEPTLYRIIQESITNSIRHGQASEVKIRLHRQGDNLLLEVEDDGHGCTNISEGYGLRGIRERAAEIEGKVSFKNNPTGGFLVSLTLEGAAV